MTKKKLVKSWHKFIAVSPWYLLVLTVISGLICLFALRANNEHMAKLRDQVYTADKNNGDIAGTLSNLQRYVTGHMNTNLDSGPNAVYPPIQLKYTYNRLVSQISDQLQSTNSTLYTQAEYYCQNAIPNGFSGRYRIPCIEQYIESHGLQQGNNIDQSLYEFDFVSPIWSPDLAGWSLVATIIFALLFILNFSVNYWHKKHNKSAG